ncbi:MAG: hypothetical protein OHK0039_35560 [Bacteroidia bacterium]
MRSVLLPLLLLAVVGASAQHSRTIDSLLGLIAGPADDRARMGWYDQLRRETVFDDPRQAQEYVLCYLELAGQQGDTFRTALGQVYLGNIHHALGAYDEALGYFLQAERYFEAQNDSVRLGSVYNGIAAAYEHSGSDSITLAYFEKAYRIYGRMQDDRRAALALNNMGNVHVNAGRLETAIFLMERAVKLLRNGPPGDYFRTCALNLANAYLEAGYFAAAERLLREMQTSAGTLPTYHEMVLRYKLGYSLLRQGHAAAAMPLLDEAAVLAREHHFSKEYLDILTDLVAAHEAAGQWQQAFGRSRDLAAQKDSLFSVEKDRNLAEALQKFEADKKNQQIELLSREAEIMDLRIAQGRRQRLMLLAGIGLLGGILVLLYRDAHIRRRNNAALAEKNALIAASLADKEILLREIHHRVKNNLQVISSLLSLQARQVSDPEALRTLEEGRNRVRTMALIHQHLYQEETLVGVDTRAYIAGLVQQLAGSYAVGAVEVYLDIAPVKLDVDVMIPMGLILNELLSNAFKYAFAAGQPGDIFVSLRDTPGGLCLDVRDTGPGLPPGFDPDQAQTLGYRLVRAFARKLQAQLSLTNQRGACVSLCIPPESAAA